MAGIVLFVCVFGIAFPPVFIPILFIPFLALCSYLTYRLLKPCCVQNICKNIKKVRKTVDKPPSPPPADRAPIDVTVTTVSLDDYADDLYADRILNPDEYKEQ